MMIHTSRFSKEVSQEPANSVLTPALLLDEAQMHRNIQAMEERLAGTSVLLRPHVKTAKSLPVIAHMVANAHAPRLTVSTLREAYEVVSAGYRDVLYAVGVVPQKLAELQRLASRYEARISVILDSVEMARALIAAQEGLDPGFRLDAFIELDVDNHRAGVAADSAELIAIGRLLNRYDDSGASASLLRGVMTHAGGAYNCLGQRELCAMAEQERSGAVRAADALRAAGIPCPEVSIGSTPTVNAGQSLAGITEARVGVYVFNDLVMAGLGVCELSDIAISVLSTVIGHQRARNTLLVDAGWMALSSDRSTGGHRVDQGLGLVLAGNLEQGPELIVASANQEHGLVTTRCGAPIDFDRYPIGTELQILPVHACATAAQFAGYHVLRPGQSTPDFWSRFGGWHV